ncbi:hypothetical protein [Streptomyces sp. NPDC002845]
MAGYEEDGQRYVSLAGLRARGWTGGTVRRLLGAPDRLSVNAQFRTAPQVRLYRVERVEAAERSQEFREMTEASARRSEEVRAAVQRRRDEVLERITAEPIDVPRLDPGKLALRAVEHRARREAELRRAARTTVDEVKVPSAETEPGGRSALDLWKVDYLLHRMSHYAQLLDGLPGHGRSSGRAEAVTLLRSRICAAIAEAYPPLAQECERRASEQGLGPPPW